MIKVRARGRHRKTETTVTLVTDQPRVPMPGSPCLLQPLTPEPSSASLTKTEALNVLLTLVTVSISYLGNLRYFNNHYREDAVTDTARTVVIVLSLAQLALVLRKVKMVRESRGVATMGEVVVHLLAIPPRVNGEMTFYLLGTSAVISLSDCSALFTLLRLYHIVLLGIYLSPYNSKKSRLHWYLLFSHIQNVHKEALWLFRTTLESFSVVTLLLLWLALAVFTGLCLNCLEHGLSTNAQTEVSDSIWCSIVAQSTMGYGDFYPHTHLGRVLITFDIIGGIMLLSTIMMKSILAISLSSAESAVYRGLCYADGKRLYLKRHSVVLIQRWWRLLLARKFVQPRLESLRKFTRLEKQYRFHLKQIETLKETTLTEDIIHFDILFTKRVKRASEELQGITKYEKEVLTM